jgi:hypothetical protein
MANSYTWNVNNLMVEDQGDLSQVVVLASFVIQGTDGTHTGQVNYSVNLLPANPSDFTPFNQITKEEAIQWVQESLGTDRVTAMQAEVDAQIAQAAVPVPQSAPLPWGQ